MKNVGKNKCVVFIILVRVCIYIYIYIYCIGINRIQNKSFCLHNICKCYLYIYYVYI